MMPHKGNIHIYTGNGKGKTLAAIGLAVRGAGAGFRSIIIQFMKDYPYSEIISLQKLSGYITLRQFGNDGFVLNKQKPSASDIEKANDGLNFAYTSMNSGNFDIVILDEILIASYFGLFSESQIIKMLDSKPANIELILTGRYAGKEVIAKADLVTEMNEVKHYYQKGILSIKGIDS
ncbi:MAG: cob(I)yrinic acid a,c-diamide adenosyltransferase [Ignavibacteriales bacterium]|nr:cob(I)yrinic acid a,c-diamide adenosyltransferase [Ignavibacteriales bacterium]MCF8306562.1 cob(I)yrinic acid a,c-diamide adenosyltransferase [Ignavibacteriales bacterium]MCF8316361.1 cob(I)yrinic acid a,c-diamide adenosyltransferase [Ignavibacteriales bacterium]MCF8437681.1 cob(I)yrinic acid a,c-diamide adenosyltransferase [Ignavibacteriales bacterium]